MTDQPALIPGCDTAPAERPIDNTYTAHEMARMLRSSIGVHPGSYWRAELWAGVGECPWVLHDSYHRGVILSRDELRQSANEGCLPPGLILRRMDGVQWCIVTGEVDKPQQLHDYSPRPREMEGLPLLVKRKRAKIKSGQGET